MRARGMRLSQILHDDQTILEKKYYVVDHATCSALTKTFRDTHADARYVCGS